MRRAALGLCAGLFALAAGGCLERTITVTSKPEGALVYLNDVEVGRTPVTTGFNFYGVYSVRLVKEGYETLDTKRRTDTPIYEYPPIDLVAAALPTRAQTKLKWDFELQPLPVMDQSHEDALLERAKELQGKAMEK